MINKCELTILFRFNLNACLSIIRKISRTDSMGVYPAHINWNCLPKTRIYLQQVAICFAYMYLICRATLKYKTQIIL